MNLSFIKTGILVAAVMCTGSQAIADAVSGTTTVSFDSNPVGLSGDASPDVTVSTLTSSGTEHGTPTTATLIDAGKVSIEYAVDGLGNIVGSGGVVSWVTVTANINPTAGATSADVDLDALPGAAPGATVAFRARFTGVNVGSGGHRVSTHQSTIVDLLIEVDDCPFAGVHVGATLSAGDGDPNPGQSDTWTFDITVTNCSEVALTDVKVQGGCTAWTQFVGALESAGNWSIKDKPQKNTVIVWLVDLPAGASEIIRVTVAGRIDCGAADGEIAYISGAWSAAYVIDESSYKTDYTGRVALEVDGTVQDPSCAIETSGGKGPKSK